MTQSRKLTTKLAGSEGTLHKRFGMIRMKMEISYSVEPTQPVMLVRWFSERSKSHFNDIPINISSLFTLPEKCKAISCGSGFFFGAFPSSPSARDRTFTSQFQESHSRNQQNNEFVETETARGERRNFDFIFFSWRLDPFLRLLLSPKKRA